MTPFAAQIIYASTPLWTALFAAVAVGEGLEPNELIGGATIIIAVLMAGMDNSQGGTQEGDDDDDALPPVPAAVALKVAVKDK